MSRSSKKVVSSHTEEVDLKVLDEMEAALGLPARQDQTADVEKRIEMITKHNPALDVMTLMRPRRDRRSNVGDKWSSEEDAMLRELVELHGAKNWKLVASQLGTERTDIQCIHRWNKPGLMKGTWSREEDDIVRSMVQNCVDGERIHWAAIAKQLPGRMGKQCRERWFNHLDPSIKRSEWTAEEDRLLIEAQRHFGNRWREIAKLIAGRPENSVKNRWNSGTLKRFIRENNIQVGDGSSMHLATKEGLLSALTAFQDALSHYNIRLSQPTDRLLSIMTPRAGARNSSGSSGGKKSAFQVELETSDSEDDGSALPGSPSALQRTNSGSDGSPRAAIPEHLRPKQLIIGALPSKAAMDLFAAHRQKSNEARTHTLRSTQSKASSFTASQHLDNAPYIAADGAPFTDSNEAAKKRRKTAHFADEAQAKETVIPASMPHITQEQLERIYRSDDTPRSPISMSVYLLNMAFNADTAMAEAVSAPAAGNAAAEEAPLHAMQFYAILSPSAKRCHSRAVHVASSFPVASSVRFSPSSSAPPGHREMYAEKPPGIASLFMFLLILWPPPIWFLASDYSIFDDPFTPYHAAQIPLQHAQLDVIEAPADMAVMTPMTALCRMLDEDEAVDASASAGPIMAGIAFLNPGLGEAVARHSQPLPATIRGATVQQPITSSKFTPDDEAAIEATVELALLLSKCSKAHMDQLICSLSSENFEGLLEVIQQIRSCKAN